MQSERLTPGAPPKVLLRMKNLTDEMDSLLFCIAVSHG